MLQETQSVAFLRSCNRNLLHPHSRMSVQFKRDKIWLILAYIATTATRLVTPLVCQGWVLVRSLT